jgi:hypothetical protein
MSGSETDKAPEAIMQVKPIHCRCVTGECIHKSDCAVHNGPAEEAGSCDCLTPSEKRALPGAHYSDGRRYSRISNAWIFAEDWNDREEVAYLRESLERTERELREARAKLATAEVRAEWWAPVYTKHRLPGPTDGPFVVTWGPNGGAGIQDWSHVSPLLHTKWAHLNPPCICADPENCKERVRGCKRDLAALSNPSNPQQPAAKSQAEQMRDPVYVLNFIANAKRFDRFHFDDDTAFADWAQSLARHVIGDPSNPEKGES